MKKREQKTSIGYIFGPNIGQKFAFMENSIDRFKANSNYIFRNIAGKCILISIGENIADFNGCIELNATAAFLWQQLGECKTVPELVTALRAEFDVNADEAEADVRDFLGELVRDDMVSTDGRA